MRRYSAGMDAEDRLRLDYDRTSDLVQSCWSTRFKLLALVPTIAGTAVGLISAPRPAVELLGIGVLGLAATVGVLLYECATARSSRRCFGTPRCSSVYSGSRAAPTSMAPKGCDSPLRDPRPLPGRAHRGPRPRARPRLRGGAGRLELPRGVGRTAVLWAEQRARTQAPYIGAVPSGGHVGGPSAWGATSPTQTRHVRGRSSTAPDGPRSQ